MYFQSNGLKLRLSKSLLLNSFLLKKNTRKEYCFMDQCVILLEYLSGVFKKKQRIFFIIAVLSKLLESRKGAKGAILRMDFRFFRNNLRGMLYVAKLGFLLCNLTGGHVAKKVLEVAKVYRRDKKGDGSLIFIGKAVKINLRIFLRFFYCKKLELYLSTYFRRYVFFKLIRRYVYKRLHRQFVLRIIRGHNSMESAKRWRRRRR